MNYSATVVAVTAAVVLVVLGLVGYGYWDTYIRPAHETAVRVGSRDYNMIYFVKRLKLAFNDPTRPAPAAAEIAELPTRLTADIIDEEVFVQRAGTLGVSVPDSEIDGYMAERLAAPFTRNDAGEVQYSRTLENAVRNRLRPSGLSVAEYRRALHGQRLRQEVRRHFDQGLAEALPAVRFRQIAVADEAKARDLKGRLDGGGDFAALASSDSDDTATKSDGGLKDWTLKGLLAPEIEQAAYTLPPGQVSEPVKSGDRWYLLKVEERTESRQVTDRERATLADKQLSDWLTARRDELGARGYLDDRERLDYALEHSNALEVARRGQGARPGQPGAPVRPGGLPPVMPRPANPPAGGTAP